MSDQFERELEEALRLSNEEFQLDKQMREAMEESLRIHEAEVKKRNDELARNKWLDNHDMDIKRVCELSLADSLSFAESPEIGACATQLAHAVRLCGKNCLDGGWTFRLKNGILFTNTCAIISILLGMRLLTENFGVKLNDLSMDLLNLAKMDYGGALHQMYLLVREGYSKKDKKFTNAEIDDIINILDLHVIRLDTGDEKEVSVGNNTAPSFTILMIGAHWTLYIGDLTSKDIKFGENVIPLTDMFKNLNINHTTYNYIVSLGLVKDTPFLRTLIHPDLF